MDRMKDKFVVVTGAAHGIGAAIAQRFAEEGAALALLDLDGAHLAETAKRLPGTQSLTIAATHGRIDVLVNNVGGSRNQKLWEMTAEAWDFTIRLNLRSAFLCVRGRAVADDVSVRFAGPAFVAGGSGILVWSATRR